MNDTAIRVLIADDQEMVRMGFRLSLGAQPGIEVVAGGAARVELARRLRPDVCLADIRMPKLDGLDVTRALAGPGVHHPMRVVVTTTFDQDDYVHTVLRNGACGFLLKDAPPSLLTEPVRAALVSLAVTVRPLKQLVAARPGRRPPAHRPRTRRGPTRRGGPHQPGDLRPARGVTVHGQEGTGQ